VKKAARGSPPEMERNPVRRVRIAEE
jgi:hypothetical protein